MNISKRSAAVLGICLALVLSVGASVLWAGDQDFVLINETGYDISEVYVSPAKDNHWGEDVMGQDVLEDGDSVTIEFDREATACMWDMKILFSDGEAVVWPAFNLCEVSEITLNYEGKRPTATVK